MKVRQHLLLLNNSGARKSRHERDLSDCELRVCMAESGQLSTAELNSLIGHAHRRVDQLQRELVEQTSMEPLRVEAALDSQRSENERMLDEKIAQERQNFASEIMRLQDVLVCFQ